MSQLTNLFAEAVQAMRQIAEPDEKALALSQIASTLASHDRTQALALLDDALRFVRQIDDPSWQLSVLLTVISAFAIVDAEQVVRLMKDLPSETTQVLALTDAAERLMERDKATALRFLRDALRIAQSIRDPDSRDEAMAAVVEAWALADADEALKLADQIRDIAQRASALTAIARTLSSFDALRAKAIAQQASELAKRLQDAEECCCWTT